MYKRPRLSALHEGTDLMGRLNSGGPRISAPPPLQSFFGAPAPLPIIIIINKREKGDFFLGK